MFAADVTTCERLVSGQQRCGGRMRIVEVATEPHDIARVMFDHGLGPRGPPRRRPARAHAGQLSLDLT